MTQVETRPGHFLGLIKIAQLVMIILIVMLKYYLIWIQIQSLLEDYLTLLAFEKCSEIAADLATGSGEETCSIYLF